MLVRYMKARSLLTVIADAALFVSTAGASATLGSSSPAASGALDSAELLSSHRVHPRFVRRESRSAGSGSHSGTSSSTISDAGKRNGTHGYRANRKVALHWSLEHDADTSRKTQNWEAKLLAVLDATKFCFDEVLITIDPVHGGKDMGPKWLPTPRGDLDVGAKELENSLPGKALVKHADAVRDKIKAWYKENCPGATTEFDRSVQVIDYSNPDNVNRLNYMFNFSDDANFPRSPWILDKEMKRFHRDYPFAWMWKNSFSYMYAIDKVQSDYVFHYDSDAHLLKENKVLNEYLEHKRPAYVGNALKMLERNPEVVMVVAPSCRRFFSRSDEWAVPFCKKGCFLMGEDQELTIIQQQDPKLDRTVLPYVSAEHYIADVKRMKSLWPFKYWADMFEATLMYNLRDQGKKYAWMNRETSDLCK
mmetsp:Transcript_127354/g.220766  ORF Transcript_127354/g.220766 Transcript_127354/m.220766 type:complete len:420 (-) Transcript_127354:85-1344(-)